MSFKGSAIETFVGGKDYSATRSELGTPTGYYLRRYIQESTSFTPEASVTNKHQWIVYRYAEALLNAAELGSPNAQKYLDEVRSRAGLGSVAANKDNIIEERAREFVGEGKRYWDVVRTGIASQVLVPSKVDGQTQFRTNSWNESRKYQPIPQSEINSSNGAIKQNAGY
jgi:hypothetical protein